MNDTRTSASPAELEAYQRLRKEYDMADKVMKDVQAFVAEAGIPAINELRYAGYHLLNSIVPADDKTTPLEELTRAINHCKRATYEASEMGILTAFDKIVQFKDDYRQVVISQVVQDWQDILTKCDSIRDALTAARQTGDDRSIDHGRFKEAFEELVRYCRRLEHARDDLNNLIAQNRIQARRYLVGSLLGGAAIVVTVAVAFL